MKIAYITAGAAGMYCGSCMKDNTLVAALNKLGHDALLLPTYTPIRTDEENVSQERVFFGGINVFLQQKLWFFRHTPWFLDRLLDVPALLRAVAPFAVRTRAEKLGGLTRSMLEGDHGQQKKEIQKLVQWLSEEHRPEIVIFSNVLLSGMVPSIRETLKVPIIATLQGDDIFLDSLPLKDRQASIDLIRRNVESIDGLIATSEYYAEYMAEYLGIPRRKISVIHPGINLKGHGGARPARREAPYTLGFFARICPEKGFHQVVDAFRALRKLPDAPPTKLKVSGWMGANQRRFFDEQRKKLEADGLLADFEHVDCPSLAEKVAFLQSIDLLSVPTVYHEPKGIYILEALANGTPVVQPAHGSFPELIERTQGGLLVEPGNPQALARAIRELLLDPARREEMGRCGAATVAEHFSAESMAKQTVSLLAEYHLHLAANQQQSPSEETETIRGSTFSNQEAR
jgi:glycosyltransferase involved in cell wall biosynthesis